MIYHVLQATAGWHLCQDSLEVPGCAKVDRWLWQNRFVCFSGVPASFKVPSSILFGGVSSKGAHAKTRGAFLVISSGLTPADRPLDRCCLLPAPILSHICGHFRSGKGQAVKQVWLVVTCYYSFYQRGMVTWEECPRVLGKG